MKSIRAVVVWIAAAVGVIAFVGGGQEQPRYGIQSEVAASATIEVREVPEEATATTVTLAWTPEPNAIGYRFKMSGGKVSHTWDSARSRVKVGRTYLPIVVEALGSLSQGEYPPRAKASLVAEAVYEGRADVTDVPLWRTHGEQAKADDRMTVVTDPLGQRGSVMKVTVKPGDSAVAGSNSGERADVMASASSVPMREGTILAVSSAILLPSEFYSNGSGWNVAFGAHDASGGTQSPLQFEIRDSRDLRLRILGGVKQPGGLGTFRADLGPWPLEKNRWHKIVWAMLFSADPKKGRAVLYVDGQKKVDQPVANLYEGSYNYHKQGWYRVATSLPTTLYFDSTRFWTADTLEAALLTALADD